MRFFPKRRRKLASSPHEVTPGNLSAKRLNLLADTLGGSVGYLEVGVEKGETFEGITAARRVGVDPKPLFNNHLLPGGVEFFETTSDKFFSDYSGESFDLIFLDGLHEARQTYRDIINAFALLKSPGFVLVDDVWPTDFASSIGDRRLSEKQKIRDGVSHRRWYGDVYKAIGLVWSSNPELSIQIIGDDKEAHAQAVLTRVDSTSVPRTAPRFAEELNRFGFADCFSPGGLKEPWRSAVSDFDFTRSLRSAN